MCEVSGAGRKTPSQCKMRWERILNPGVKRGLWTKEEDQKLKEVAAAMDYKWSHVSLVSFGADIDVEIVAFTGHTSHVTPTFEHWGTVRWGYGYVGIPVNSFCADSFFVVAVVSCVCVFCVFFLFVRASVHLSRCSTAFRRRAGTSHREG